MANRKNAKKKKLVIVLDVTGDPDFMWDTIDGLLDSGAIVDLIDDWVRDTYDGEGRVPQVVNATVHIES